MKSIILTTFTILLPYLCFSQFVVPSPPSEEFYIPSSMNTPYFGSEDAVQIGTKINNYGLHFGLAAQYKRKIVIFDFQTNNGNINFNPLRLNKSRRTRFDDDFIARQYEKTNYGEFGIGYNINIGEQKLALIGGLGHEFEWDNTRFFTQIDWGNESRLLDAGLSMRANYTNIDGNNFFLLEPSIQGKIKLNSFRIISQFAYSILLEKELNDMIPIFTMGLEYKISSRTKE